MTPETELRHLRKEVIGLRSRFDRATSFFEQIADASKGTEQAAPDLDDHPTLQRVRRLQAAFVAAAALREIATHAASLVRLIREYGLSVEGVSLRAADLAEWDEALERLSELLAEELQPAGA